MLQAKGIAFRRRIEAGSPVWVPFAADELPKDITPQLKKAAAALKVGADELRRAAGMYELFLALGEPNLRSMSLDADIFNPIETVRTSLIRNVVLIAVALFDNDGRSIHLTKLMNQILDPKNRKVLQDFHIFFPTNVAVLETLISRLNRLQKRVKSKIFRTRLERLSRVRSKLIAHYDFEDGIAYAEIANRDVAYLIIVAAQIARLSTMILTTRIYDVKWTRLEAMKQAQRLVEVITQGCILLSDA